MSKHRYAAKTDLSQPDVVKSLRAKGISVYPGHDDFLVGWNGKTTWVEWKEWDVWKKSGGLKAGALKPSQQEIVKSWKGSYIVAWTEQQILTEIGFK